MLVSGEEFWQDNSENTDRAYLILYSNVWCKLEKVMLHYLRSTDEVGISIGLIISFDRVSLNLSFMRNMCA